MLVPESIESRLFEDDQIRIIDQNSVSGGSINHAVRLRTNRGDLFLKWNTDADPDMFEKEARGLDLLRTSPADFYIPEIITWNSQTPSAPGFILMEYIEQHSSGLNTKHAAELFGEQLAHLHQQQHSRFGLDHDNYIGRLPQSNHHHKSWTNFFIHERIEPQLHLAVDTGVLSGNIIDPWEKLASKLEQIFPPTTPSLLHGDLWSGNYFYDSTGKTVLIDPAVYYGHPEMDLSFTRMFGGFPASFYDSYFANAPVAANFTERIPVYNLYPLLVHANLFGGHYAGQVENFLNRF